MRVGVFLLAARFPGQSDDEVLTAPASVRENIARLGAEVLPLLPGRTG